MATIRFSGIDKYLAQLEQLGQRSRGICKMAVYDGAAIVADQVRENLERVLSPDATGQLEASMGISKMRDDNGYINVVIGFDGYDDKGVANQLKANVLESGSSKQQKRPFMRPAVNTSRKRAEAKMAETLDREIEKLMK